MLKSSKRESSNPDIQWHRCDGPEIKLSRNTVLVSSHLASEPVRQWGVSEEPVKSKGTSEGFFRKKKRHFLKLQRLVCKKYQGNVENFRVLAHYFAEILIIKKQSYKSLYFQYSRVLWGLYEEALVLGGHQS